MSADSWNTNYNKFVSYKLECVTHENENISHRSVIIKMLLSDITFFKYLCELKDEDIKDNYMLLFLKNLTSCSTKNMVFRYRSDSCEQKIIVNDKEKKIVVQNLYNIMGLYHSKPEFRKIYTNYNDEKTLYKFYAFMYTVLEHETKYNDTQSKEDALIKSTNILFYRYLTQYRHTKYIYEKFLYKKLKEAYDRPISIFDELFGFVTKTDDNTIYKHAHFVDLEENENLDVVEKKEFTKHPKNIVISKKKYFDENAGLNKLKLGNLTYLLHIYITHDKGKDIYDIVDARQSNGEKNICICMYTQTQ